MDYQHQPVMIEEVMNLLNPSRGGRFLDCTLGGAGYTLALAKAVGPTGKIISLDLDQLAISHAQELIKEAGLKNIVLVQENFKSLSSVLKSLAVPPASLSGIVFDLGLSSAQLDDQERGFSFQGDRPLDMAFGASERTTTDIVNHYGLLELTKIFREYGEEPRAYQAAKAIVDFRRRHRITTTGELKIALSSALFSRPGQRLHPATRIFQALRLETNEELGSLALALPQALEALAPGGHLVVVAFHSGEDRLVKLFIREAAKAGKLSLLVKKPLVPNPTEIAANPRARSAKLRGAEKH